MKRLFNRVPLGMMLGAMVALICVTFFPHSQVVALSLVGGGVGMIIDAQNQLSSAQAMSTVGNNLSTNVIDLVTAFNFLGSGEPMGIMVNVVTALAGTTPTAQFQVQQSANSNMSSPDTIYSTDTTYLAAAKLVAGYKFFLPLPRNLITKRYLALNVVLGGTTPTITITAEVLPMSQAQDEQVYPKNFVISS